MGVNVRVPTEWPWEAIVQSYEDKTSIAMETLGFLEIAGLWESPKEL